jgi:glyoxylase-like metal-dependent hydrolase (beta-lactamase superfamily II)
VDEVIDGVLRIGLGFVNAYLVVTDEGLVLVDTGLPRTHAKLQRALGDAKRSIGDIRTVLLTHWHTDHTGGLPRVRATSGARVVASATDASVVTGARPAPLTTFLKLTKPLTGNPGHSPVDEAVAADGPISVPGFTAVQTPGHTAGHLSYLLDRSGGLLFVGDAAASARSKVRYAPRLVAEDHGAEKRSVAKLASLQFDVAVFGHGAPVTGRAVERFRELAAD